MSRDLFAKRLKTLRMSRGLTLQNVGDIAGCNRQNISNLENARVSPSLAMAMMLADFFDVSLDYLVGRADSPGRTPANDGGEPDETVPEQNMERQKMIGMIEALHEENADKALSYIVFLRHIQRREDRKKRRLADNHEP